MDENLINQYAFEIFSRARIFEAEFEILKAEEILAFVSKFPDNDRNVLLHKSVVGSAKQKLEELKSQIEKFRQQKGINN